MRAEMTGSAVSEHRDIVAALAAGDAEGALALMDHHLDAGDGATPCLNPDEGISRVWIACSTVFASGAKQSRATGRLRK